MTKKFFFSLLIIFLYLSSAHSVTYNSEPKIFIQELVDDTIKTLSDTSLTIEEKHKFVEKVAKENVDIDGLSLYTLGKIRKDIDSETLSEYQNLFEDYFLKSLTSRLSDYSDSKIEVLGAEQKSSNYTIVNSKIIPKDGSPEIKIDWRIYTKNPEKPLIRDLIVEGLSLARTQKEEFASILSSNNNNLDKLIDKLQEFLNK